MIDRRRFLSTGLAGVAAAAACLGPAPKAAPACGCLQLLPATSEYDIATPITLNDWTAVPLSGFSLPIPNCRLLLASVMVFGSSNTGDGLQVAAANADTTPENVVQIIDAAFSYNTVASTGLVFIPALADHLRLYFNTDPAAPLLQVLIRAVGYMV